MLASTSLVPGPSGSGGGLSGLPSTPSRSSQTAAFPSSSSRAPQVVASCLETIQQFARAGFSAAVAAQVGLTRRPSSRTSYQLKWSFKNTKNLFIHIARIPIGDSPRDIPTF